MNRKSSALARTAQLLALLLLNAAFVAQAEDSPPLEVGLAVRDITPSGPVWLAGYAARKHPAEKVDSPLLTQAVAFKSGQTAFVLVALDNCEINRRFGSPIYQQAEREFNLKPGQVMIVSSHTHSAPVLAGALEVMYDMPAEDWSRIRSYSRQLQEKIIDAVRGALADLKPARLEYGLGRATFAMNRRVYRENTVAFGENPEGPVDWSVPVLKVLNRQGALRAILFGYACHGTSIAGDDFYTICGDYMAYARQDLEKVFPGATAVYVTGMGADSNPSPRGALLEAKRHGLELAGAVASVLNRPMRPLQGRLSVAYDEIDLPLPTPPSQAALDADTKNPDLYVRRLAGHYLQLLRDSKPLPASVKLPLGVIRIGPDLTFLAMGGEPVVDYDLRLKRIYQADHPWAIGYAYDVPCYIPSLRILKEGGYEAQSSLVYYGYYGPLEPKLETMIYKKFQELVSRGF